jgi:hypothetical protein
VTQPAAARHARLTYRFQDDAMIFDGVSADPREGYVRVAAARSA